MKVHKMVRYYDFLLACGMATGHWAARWKGVTCRRCLAHRKTRKERA